MTTHISIVDDYTMARVSPSPVVGIYTLFQPVPESAPVGTVEPVAEEDEAPKADVEAKVVKSPGKAAPKASASAEGVETK